MYFPDANKFSVFFITDISRAFLIINTHRLTKLMINNKHMPVHTNDQKLLTIHHPKLPADLTFMVSFLDEVYFD